MVPLPGSLMSSSEVKGLNVNMALIHCICFVCCSSDLQPYNKSCVLEEGRKVWLRICSLNVFNCSLVG